MNLVVFDFCETIVSIQTADRFVDFVCANSEAKYSKMISLLDKFLMKSRFYAVFNKLLPKFNLQKKVYLFKIKGTDAAVLGNLSKRYYEEVIKPAFNPALVSELVNYDRTKYSIYVVSGGYDPYLELFCKDYNIDYLFSSKIGIKNNSATGFMEGTDCMFDEKVKKLEQHIRENQLHFEQKIVYSDSITDMPLFLWADEQIVISYGKPQNWAKDNNFKEIILNK